MMKYCNKCEKLLPIESFYKGDDCSLGVRSSCKDCGKEEVKRYRNTEKGIINNRIASKKYYHSVHGNIHATEYRKSDKRKHNLSNKTAHYDNLQNKPITKICTKCNMDLPLNCYGRSIGGKYNLRSICKACNAVASKEYRQSKRGKEVFKRYYNSSHGKQIIKNNNDKYRKTEKRKIYQRKYKDSEKYKEKNSEYLNSHKYKTWKKNYYKTDKGKVAISRWGHRRRSKIKTSDATLTISEWEKIKKIYHNRCVYCGEIKPLHRDHIIPVNNGGCLVKNNIVPACKSCNSKKGAKSMLLSMLAMVDMK